MYITLTFQFPPISSKAQLCLLLDINCHSTAPPNALKGNLGKGSNKKNKKIFGIFQIEGGGSPRVQFPIKNKNKKNVDLK